MVVVVVGALVVTGGGLVVTDVVAADVTDLVTGEAASPPHEATIVTKTKLDQRRRFTKSS
jgi:hypothetical protein